MKQFYKIVLILVVLVINTPVFSQIRVSGFVSDSLTGERLIGANIYIPQQQKGVVTDNDGYFTLIIQEEAVVNISYTGYNSRNIRISESNKHQLHIQLAPGKELEGVVIRAKSPVKANVNTMAMKEILSIPSLTGKPDVLKALHMFPGIQTQSEASALLLVRGGSPGENLYLFDNVPVIYVNHLGGFMSVFNPDIINSIELYKGGFPAQYGGKLSSVVDITQKEGTREKHRGSFSIGVTDASLLLEGPIGNKATYIFTGRKTLFDFLMLGASALSGGNGALFSYGFHDFNGKISWRPNEKNSVHLNLYQGDDYLNYWIKNDRSGEENKNRVNTSWGNWLGSLHWKRVINSNLFAENIVSYTRYRLKNTQNSEYFYADTNAFSYDYRFHSRLQDVSYQSNWKYNPYEFWNMKWGVKTSFLQFIPSVEYLSNDDNHNDIQTYNTNESALYLDNNFNLGKGFSLDAGLRVVKFFTDAEIPVKIEPRLSLYKQFGNQEISISYMQTNQFAQLLFTPGSIASNEVWVPTGRYIPPSSSEQYTMNWNGSFANDGYQAEVSLYYKTLDNLTTFREGFSSLRGSANWNTKVGSGGTGTSYGLETQLKKMQGDWTGFVSYGWSKTTRQFPFLNSGEIYPYEYDRPHTASLNIRHDFSPRYSFSCSWVYQTGTPYTPVIGKQLTASLYPNDDGEYDYYEALIYGDRNSARMKDYHRLDVALTVNNRNAEGEVKSAWTFSIYNLYNRKNPTYYYYNTNNTGEIYKPSTYTGSNQDYTLRQLSLFPIIPAVSYKCYFDVKRVKDWTFHKRLRDWLYYENK